MVDLAQLKSLQSKLNLTDNLFFQCYFCQLLSSSYSSTHQNKELNDALSKMNNEQLDIQATVGWHTHCDEW